MKRIVVVTLAVVIFLSGFAQAPMESSAPKGTLSGIVVDNKTKQPLPYVNIIIKDSKNIVLTGGITDEKGRFEIKKITNGKNVIEIQYIGYKTLKKEVEFSRKNRNVKLGTVEIEEDASQLDEVVVRADVSTVVQKVDRKVINVGKDLTAAGSSASEVLNNIQSVSVDSQTGSVSLRGNENVRILVDGKPTNLSASQVLKQIPSNSIKSVELITNPSAKYNPEGMSGIINIVLNKNANIGFNGNVNFGATYGENFRGNGSLDMNYKTGKVNYFMNFGHNQGQRSNDGEVFRYFSDGSKQNIQDFNFEGDNMSDMLKVGADIYLNKKNTLSFYTIQNQYIGKNNGKTSIIWTDKSYPNNLILFDSESKYFSSTYNANYKYTFAKDHTLELEANYRLGDSDEDTKNKQQLDLTDKKTNYKDDVNNDSENILLNLDYTNSFSDNSKIELGAEVRIDGTDNKKITNQHGILYGSDEEPIKNNDGTFKVGALPIYGFDFNRSIYSAYINFNHKIDKFNMQFGARFEQYKVDADFIRGDLTKKYKDDIFSIYPSAFLTYSLSKRDQLQFSYSRRVDRPSVGQINPIREWSSPLITSVGNPDLKPQFTNSFEVNFTKGLPKGSLSLGTFYRLVNDNMTRSLSKDPDEPQKQILSFANTDNSERYGFEASFNYRPTKWWMTNASADLYIQELEGYAAKEKITVENNSFNIRMMNNFNLNKKLRLQLFAMYRHGGEDLQFKIEPMWMVNAGMSYTCLKGKGTFTFRVNDIFKGMKFAFESKVPYNQSGEFHWESRTVHVGFSYRFGSGKNRALRRKNRGNKDEGGGSGGLF